MISFIYDFSLEKPVWLNRWDGHFFLKKCPIITMNATYAIAVVKNNYTKKLLSKH